MSITNNNAVAKVAAVVAGLGLVAMSFASFAPAQAQSTADLQAQINSLLATIASLQAQLGGSASASASMTFTRDLTIGATGADVTALQTWLISKGYSIPAGATGFFGAQTQAAVAAYQAANGITPAAGFFGPITRAKVNASASTSTGTSTGTGTGTSTTLKGGEADLTNYNLTTGDTVTEGDTNIEIASAKFDVNGGDVNVSRVKVEVQSTGVSGASSNPWIYFSKLYVYDGSTKVGSVDAGSRSDWDSNSTDTSMNSDGTNDYTIDIPVNDVVKDGDTAELSVRADAQSTIDSANVDQTFTFRIPDNGIRAVDAAGIQEYSGSNSDKVTVDFNGNSAGKLTVSEDSSDPSAGVLVADSTQSTNDLTVFAFKLKNTQNSDSLVDTVKLTVATTTGGTGAADNITDIIRKATLTLDGKDYDGTVNTNNTISFDLTNDNVVVSGNGSVVGTVKIDLASQSGHYSATGESLTFSVAAASDVTAEGVSNGNSTTVSGTATGNKQSIALNGGISVQGSDMSTNLTYNSNTPASSYGTFTLKFDVTAVGDDVYVPKTVADSNTSSTTYTGIKVQTDMVGSTTSSAVTTSLTTTAASDNSNFYVVHAGDTETFTVTATIDPTATDDFQVGVDSIKFSTTDSNLNSLQTLDIDQTDSQFHTDPLHIPNS